MERIVALKTHPLALQLTTDAGSILMVFPGGAIIKVGFLDAPNQAVTNFSHRLYYRDGIVYHELNNHRGKIQQIPVAEADDTPKLRAWLAQADWFIP